MNSNLFDQSSSRSKIKEWIVSCIERTVPPCRRFIRKSYDFIDKTYINVSISEYVPTLHPYDDLDNRNPTSSQIRQDIRTTVFLSDLINPSSQNEYINDVWMKIVASNRNRSTTYGSHDKIESISSYCELEIVWDPIISQTTTEGSAVDNILYVECTWWLLTIASEGSTHTYDINMTNTKDILGEKFQYVMHENDLLTNLQRSCIESLKRQFIILTNTKLKASEQIPADPSRDADHSPNGYFNLSATPVFNFNISKDQCFEPIWCDHTLEMQRRIKSWQYPDDDLSYLSEIQKNHRSQRYRLTLEMNYCLKRYDILHRRSCSTAKFLLYEPASNQHGIGSILQQLASAFRYSICLNRILVLVPPVMSSSTMMKWSFSGCNYHPILCYFEEIHGCNQNLSKDDLLNARKFLYYTCHTSLRSFIAAVSEHGRLIDEYPLKDDRIVRLKGLPSYGPCSLCGDNWDIRYESHGFFDGLAIDRDYTNPSILAISPVDHDTFHMSHMGSMLTTIKLPWIAQFIRYIFRPRKWFNIFLQRVVHHGIIGPNNISISLIPRPFVSLHVRLGQLIDVYNTLSVFYYMASPHGSYV